MIAYKSSRKNQDSEWSLVKCSQCNFQIKKLTKETTVEFYSNLETHYEHFSVQIDLSQSKVEIKDGKHHMDNSSSQL